MNISELVRLELLRGATTNRQIANNLGCSSSTVCIAINSESEMIKLKADNVKAKKLRAAKSAIEKVEAVDHPKVGQRCRSAGVGYYKYYHAKRLTGQSC